MTYRYLCWFIVLRSDILDFDGRRSQVCGVWKDSFVSVMSRFFFRPTYARRKVQSHSEQRAVCKAMRCVKMTRLYIGEMAIPNNM
jgi:hypothetical protein